MEHLGQEFHDLGMQVEFRLLNEQRAAPVHHRPQEGHKPERAVGNLIFSLPVGIRSPMLVTSLKMRNPDLVLLKFQVSKLWHRDPQRLLDSLEPRLPNLGPAAGNLLQKIAAECFSR